ncbi:MAG TPA: GTP-binding protein [Candidatus Limnocylindrales bacterium]
MRTLNLGILAHVDAGKTTLTERLVFTTGAIDHVGSVDAGTTQTDSLDLERERGITIRSAVATFQVGDLAVNLVDTPGHPDFIAEVERVLGVLDGAVLVVSAVEGIQPQTPLLFRALQRLRVPTLIFVNKTDRAGADFERVLDAMRRRLSPAAVAQDAAKLPEILAENNEAILRAFVADDGSLSDARLRKELGVQTRRALVYPVFVGSASRGLGIAELLAGIDEFLFAQRGDPDAPVSGRVFKIERNSSGERVAYVRLFAGTLRPRQRVRVGGGEEQKPTSVRVFAPAGSPRRDTLMPGEMAVIRGLGTVRVGDAIGEPPPGEEVSARFARPALEAVVVARDPAQQGSLRAALNQLAGAGSADRRAPGRPAPRDLCLALRRGPQGGHRRDPRARIRHRRRLQRDDDGMHRAARAGRRGRGDPARQDAHQHHRPQLAAEHEPVPGDAGPAHRAPPARLRG